METREAALRFVPGTTGRPGAANLEVKCVDLAANPYLLLGALIGGGAGRPAPRKPLPEPITGDPVRLPARLACPPPLDEAADAFAGTRCCVTALAGTLFDAVIAVRRAEAARFRDAGPEDVVAALRWVY